MNERDFFDDLGCGDLFGRGRGRRRSRWRLFERGDLKFVILRLVSEEPMHGYQVMQALEEEAGPWYKPSAGSVYPTLQMLEDEGLVKGEAQGGKKVYEITDEGRAYLEENGDLVQKIFDRVGAFADGVFKKESRDLTGAFSRLAQTVIETTFTARLDADTTQKLVEILDGARADMEAALHGDPRDEGEGDPGEETEGVPAEDTEDDPGGEAPPETPEESEA
jgi:DNA-binding PadR family transcriptional regulator